MSKILFLAALFVVTTATPSRAGFNAPIVPGFRGQPDTLYAGWESYTHPIQLPNPADVPGSSPSATLTQGFGNAFVDGLLNLQTIDLMAVSITDRYEGDLVEAVVQFATIDLPIQESSLVIIYSKPDGSLAGVAPHSIQSLLDDGSRREIAATWDLSMIADCVDDFRIEFVAFGAFGSLDAVELDLRFGPPAVVPSCSGDGSLTACPCSNGGRGRGCAAPGIASGALLQAQGAPATDDVVITVSGLRTDRAPAVVLLRSQGTPGPAFFGDGLLCTDGQAVPITYGLATQGSYISALPHAGAAGTFTYQAMYRSHPVGYCDPFSGFNTTNGLTVRWP